MSAQTTQLSLFACDLPELESAALLVAELDQEITDLEGQRKDAAAALRESSEAAKVRDLAAQIKEAKNRRAAASKALYSLKRAGV
jgi:predicted  nucleic acid-binding Zn-ribbon protein